MFGKFDQKKINKTDKLGQREYNFTFTCAL